MQIKYLLLMSVLCSLLGCKRPKLEGILTRKLSTPGTTNQFQYADGRTEIVRNPSKYFIVVRRTNGTEQMVEYVDEPKFRVGEQVCLDY